MKTFTVKPEAHRRYRCNRCGREVASGERLTIERLPSQVVTRHAGAKCPPVYSRRPL
jgi:DNA-directed RNA polymerase subunit RPC12/RpoP